VGELLIRSGVLQVGSPDSEVIQGVRASAREHGLPLEEFSAEQIEHRLPLFRIPAGHVGLFEPDGGVLRVERCVAAMIGQAVKLGGDIISDTRVTGWTVSPHGLVEVQTSSGKFTTERLIVAAGAWSRSLLPDLNLPIRVVRKQQHWFQLDRVEQKLVNQCPAFLFEQEDGKIFYGIPELDYLGMKVCEHTGGITIEDPATVNRDLDTDELSRVEAFMQRTMNFNRSRLVHFSACLYSMSPDQHFIVDRHPEFPQVAFVAGLSGHGFKFATVLGHYLVELVDGNRDPGFAFLRRR
jgi:glycine/D-amino acid oxidase-like deaminating enzyme